MSAEVDARREKGRGPCPDYVAAQVADHTFAALALGEHVPEAEGLVACSCYYGGAVGAHRQVEDSECVAC